MKSNYDILGNHIRLIDNRNTDSITDRVLGINIDKFFMPSVANVIGTDLSRISVDLSFDEYDVQYFRLFANDVDNIGDLFDNAGCNYEYVIKHYSRKQTEFIHSIHWTSV